MSNLSDAIMKQVRITQATRITELDKAAFKLNDVFGGIYINFFNIKPKK